MQYDCIRLSSPHHRYHHVLLIMISVRGLGLTFLTLFSKMPSRSAILSFADARLQEVLGFYPRGEFWVWWCTAWRVTNLDARIQGDLGCYIWGKWSPRDPSEPIFSPDGSLGSISRTPVASEPPSEDTLVSGSRGNSAGSDASYEGTQEAQVNVSVERHGDTGEEESSEIETR